MMENYCFMSNKPDLLYKYRSISSAKELLRVLDIIQKNRIFAPSSLQLNDPFEGFGAKIKIPGWAGMGAYIDSNEGLPPIEIKKKSFRVVSLSSEPASAYLWAHYANQYRGVCLCFSTDGVFKNAAPVEYSRPNSVWVGDNPEKLMKAIGNCFFYKEPEWCSEKEWRLVLRYYEGLNEEDKVHLYYNESDLKGVIIGHKLPKEIAEQIIFTLPKGCKVLKTDPAIQDGRIKFLPWDYELPYLGCKKQYIDDLESYLLYEDTFFNNPHEEFV